MTKNLTKIVQGTGIFDFSITGQALIVDEPIDAVGQCQGKIVFVKYPSPDVCLIMKECAGIVAETGGMVSHLAIIGLEMGVPIIVGAKDALNLINTGTYIKIESSARVGTIYEID